MKLTTPTRTHIRLIALGALVALVTMAVACGDDDDDDAADSPTRAATTAAPVTSPTSGATQPAAQAVSIGVADNKYEPATQTVQRGAKVTWNWTGSNPHTVEGKFGGADVKSERQSSGKFEFTFAQAGTFDYQCGVHGAAMAGKVTVQ